MPYEEYITQVIEGRVCSLPAQAGIGLRDPHVADMVERKPDVPWLEVHSENYIGQGNPRRENLDYFAEIYPISCHGVGLSLGSAEGLSLKHLKNLKNLYDELKPISISEHVAWSVNQDTYFNDLLPLPYTKEVLDVVAKNIDTAQQYFGRKILIENPSTYLEFNESTMPEHAFMAELVERCQCGLLLDINNIYVTCKNHHFDSFEYLESLPLEKVGEVHLAGHSVCTRDGKEIRIDDHSCMIIEPVWELYEYALTLMGARPTLIEWDTDIPSLDVLLGEAKKAQARLDLMPLDDNHSMSYPRPLDLNSPCFRAPETILEDKINVG